MQDNFDSYFGNLRAEMKIFCPNQYSRVLEVGCGKGDFRKNLTLPHEYWGVEPVVEVANR